MKALILGLAAAGALAVLPLQVTEAHGSRARVSIGVGVGLGRHYGYRYYPRYAYGYYPRSYYYPSSYIGFSVWPRYRSTRTRTVREGQVRNDALYVYPAAGQSEAQLAEDRFQCHVWAADASDYDPTQGAGTREEAANYGRAFTACMEGRDYVVK